MTLGVQLLQLESGDNLKDMLVKIKLDYVSEALSTATGILKMLTMM